MRSPLAALILAFAVLAPWGAAARDLAPVESPLTSLRASLEALKKAAPEAVPAALPPLNDAAARLSPTDPAAAAALKRFKAALAAAAAADPRKLPDAAKDVGARGDELAAALSAVPAGPGRAAPNASALAEKQLARSLPENVGQRAARVMNGGFETSAGPGSLSAVGPTLASPGPAGVPYLPSAVVHAASDLGIAVPGPQPSGAKTPSGFHVFAEAFDAQAYAPAGAAALEYMRPFMMMKPPGMPADALPQVAQASQFTAANFLMHLNLPAYAPESALNHPEAFVTPQNSVSIKTFGFQAPVPAPSNIQASASLSGTTIEPKPGGIMPVPRNAKAVQIVTAGGSFAVNGLPQVSGAVSFSSVGNPTYKGEVAGLAQGLKVTATYREAGGVGNMPRSMGAGFTYEVAPGQNVFGNASRIDRPGSLNPKETTFLDFRAGYSVALNSVP